MGAGVSQSVINRHVAKLRRKLDEAIPGGNLDNVRIEVTVSRASNGEVAIYYTGSTHCAETAHKIRNLIGPWFNRACEQWE